MNPVALKNSTEETAAYLRTLPAIRERCGRVHALAKDGKLEYFDYHPEKEADAAAFCVEIMKRDFGNNLAAIPPHGRWRHLDAGHPRVEPLVEKWKAAPNPPDLKEITRRLIDLFLVSVLLDAGAGNRWTYMEEGSGQRFTRSEGLGVASIAMFEAGFFSGDSSNPHQVDAEGLSKVTAPKVAEAMQVTDANPMVGLEGRSSLLVNLSKALKSNSTYFGSAARPGHISITENDGSRRVHVFALWTALIDGLAPIWPATRTTLGGKPLGDVWPCNALKKASVAAGTYTEGDELVPFHKLTGARVEIEGIEFMTGLPEYRNGGLLLDLGVLSLRQGVLDAVLYPDPDTGIPKLPPSHPAIIEWRAMTVIELDRIADEIRRQLGLTAEQLTLAQVLESATWKGGREIALQKRPSTGGPPIEIESDGTVF
ncbi:hypothetical protein C8T65DRAFT_640089 [Cerioporus squamosus]|nr:hypothetical protein C8T65DRAFT_640089 [Cerioporus squamosus]